MTSAFKQLFTQMIEAGGDAKGLSKAVSGQQIKVQVKGRGKRCRIEFSN